jgi:hypothetical protein
MYQQAEGRCQGDGLEPVIFSRGVRAELAISFWKRSCLQKKNRDLLPTPVALNPFT